MKVVSSKFNISKTYILKRIIARFIVYISFFLNKIPLLNILLNKLFKNLMDVEGVFYKLDVEREIENIIFINSLIAKNKIKYLIDIGGNYGQFSSKINLNSSDKYIYEPNNRLIKYIKRNNPQSNIFNSGVVVNKGNYTFINVKGNSGASYISENKKLKNNLISTISVSNLIKDLKNKINLDKTLIKIDIEGGEVELIKKFNSLKNSNIFNYAFECLNKSEIIKVRKILNNHNLYTVRFKYQGLADKNYSSIFDVIKVFFNGNDLLNIYDISKSNLERNFYSLVFCIPKINNNLILKLFDK